MAAQASFGLAEASVLAALCETLLNIANNAGATVQAQIINRRTPSGRSKQRE